MSLGPTELIIILVIVIVLFGVGRISKIAGELGTGIRRIRHRCAGERLERLRRPGRDRQDRCDAGGGRERGLRWDDNLKADS